MAESASALSGIAISTETWVRDPDFVNVEIYRVGPVDTRLVVSVERPGTTALKASITVPLTFPCWFEPSEQIPLCIAILSLTYCTAAVTSLLGRPM